MEEIIEYLTKTRKWTVGGGKPPYFLFIFEDKKKDYTLMIWFTNNTNKKRLPASVELHSQNSGECYFNGHIYNLQDLKTILYLVFDCVKKGYVTPERKEV